MRSVPFWWTWPSLVVELISGLIVAVVVAGWPSWWTELLLGTVLSVGYELALDTNGWSFKDVAQRELGILVGIALVQVIR